MTNEFESVFRKFVTGFGGEVIPETSDSKVADYLFRKQNIIAELKCLMRDQTETMTQKVVQIAIEWIRTHNRFPPGYDGEFLEIAKVPKMISDKWLDILRSPVENLIRDANRQIRETKTRLALSDAKGLVLVFNQANQLHNRPHDFRRLLENVLRKRDAERKLRFPNIHGLVYFSFETVKSEPHQMSFWAPMQVRERLSEDVTPMQTFQRELRDAWYSFVEVHFGKKVRQHDIE
ncbi:MAG: hypothetical protein WA254_03535 [Candidatus Sulfotelmatobacter sp.]